MIRSLLPLSGRSHHMARRRNRHRRLEIQNLEEKKMMTVAACVLPNEVPAAIAPNQVDNLAGDNTVSDQQAIADQNSRDQQGENENDGKSGDQSGETDTSTGTTVQLPTFAITKVTTTVSVPDGGTVLLGGINRLSEGRNDPGVPLLNKIPYVSRLFHNHAIRQESTSLMLMVTPRIIIQEEE